MLNLDFITSHRIFLLIIVSLSVSVESFTYTSDRSSVAHSSISLSGDNRFYHEISGKYRDSKIGLKRSVFGSLVTGSQLFMSEEASSEKKKRPETFREAEVYGLDLLRQGNYEDALKAFKLGMTLPGSKMDIIRKPMSGGPSPVGGAAGGREGSVVYGLDEFERQAGYYNCGCCYAKLGNISEAVRSLKSAFDSGFDDWKTVRADPDMAFLQGTPEFEALMDQVDPKLNFPNPFSIFGKK